MRQLTEQVEHLGETGVFSPLSLGSMELTNRFVMPAMQRGRQIEQPDDLLIDYYRSRAAGGVSLVISESCLVEHPTAHGEGIALTINDGNIDAWARCVDAVQRAGGSFLIQLLHMGAIRREGSGRNPEHPTISPSGLIQKDKPNGRAATAEEMEDLTEAFVKGASAAKAAGADGVEVHAAHGYLLDQFLWSETNLRTDGYGGPDIRDRVRFPAEIVKAIRTAVGPDFMIGFRFSQWKEVDYDARICDTPEDLELMLSALKEAGVDVFHASTRYYWKPEWDTDKTISAWCKALTDIPVIMVGSVGLDIDTMTTFFEERESISTAKETIADLQRRFSLGEFDLVAVGRGVIGDAQWVRKVSEGKFESIRPFVRSDLDMSDWDMGFVEEAQEQRSDASHPS